MGSNIELGEEVFFLSFGVVLEIVLLRRKVDMMGKTFSSSFVRDCRNCTCYYITGYGFKNLPLGRKEDIGTCVH